VFISLSFLFLYKSSNASFPKEIANTNKRGAMYVNKNPTLRAGMNYDRLIKRKKKL
jgi:hypothetical protein